MKIKNLKLKILLPIILAILPLFLSAFLLFLKDPPVWPDEGTSLYMAKTLLETGKMQAYNYGGIPEVAKSAGLGFPPFYFLLLGLWTQFFGETIEAIRALSLVIGILCVIVFYFLIITSDGGRLKRSGSHDSSEVDVFPFLGALLLSFNIQFAQAARWGRPEILTLLLILLSLLFWYKNTSDGGRRTPPRWNAFFAFLFASLALGVHPAGFLAPGIIGLGILFSKESLKQKLLHLFLLGGVLAITTGFGVFTTQDEPVNLIRAWELGSVGKLGQQLNLLEFFATGGVRSVVNALGLVIPLTLFVIIAKSKLWSLLYIPTATLFSIAWALFLKEGYYFLLPQPFIILSIILLISLKTPRGWRILLISFLIFSNLYLQFFNITSYTPGLAFWQLSSFNYHDLTTEIKKYITPGVGSDSPGVDGSTTLFLASIPDPYLDLRKNPNYTLYQAIDPNYPVDAEDYKKTLDSSDYVIFTWFPHDYLAYYVQTNAESVTPVTGGGYTVQIAKLRRTRR